MDVVEISESSSDATKSPALPRSLAGRRKSSRHSIHTQDIPEDTNECSICHVMKNEDREELLQCSKCSTAGNYTHVQKMLTIRCMLIYLYFDNSYELSYLSINYLHFITIALTLILCLGCF